MSASMTANDSPPAPSTTIADVASSTNLLDDLQLKCVTPEETLNAARNIQGHAVRTPLVRLNYRRPDYPNLEIYLKLETLQPINSFKVRGAVHKILQNKRKSKGSNQPDDHGLASDNDGDDDVVMVSASAGNMGQGVAYAAQLLGCKKCIVVVPDHAPETKLNAMRDKYNAKIVKVPFNRWWEIIMTGHVTSAELSLDCEAQDLTDRTEEQQPKILFVHPVCDPDVVAGNSTIGLEILQDLPSVDAVFCPWGGGGCACGIGSVLKNIHDQPDCYAPSFVPAPSNYTNGDVNAIDMIAVEPATAAPLCYSFNNNKTLTPLPAEVDDELNSYRPSWIDGCGGKSILPPMWGLAKTVLTGACKVELEAVERAVQVLVEQNRIVPEGAGACSVAAAMFGPIQPSWKKVVAVVSGGCIDTNVLTRILAKDFTKPYIPTPGFSYTNSIVRSSTSDASTNNLDDRVLTGSDRNHRHRKVESEDLCTALPYVLSTKQVRTYLPMNECIEAVERAFVAYTTGTGGMPLRQVVKLPFPNDNLSPPANKIGFLASMPSYTNNGVSPVPGTSCRENDFAACKCISVFPSNSQTNGRFSSHQGSVLLWNKGGHGELLLIADAHEVTKIRTAAASAVATRAILGHDRLVTAKVLSILGTGDQARSHIEAMLVILPNLEEIRIWGRNGQKAVQLQQHVLSGAAKLKCPTDPTVSVHDSVRSCIDDADVICTVTSATTPIISDEHLPYIKRDCHINAVGACQPPFHELSPSIFDKSVNECTINKVFTDSVEVCLKEPGDVLAYLESTGNKDAFVSVGTLNARKNDENAINPGSEVPGAAGFTIFKSLGIALEDLFAAKVLYETLTKP